MLVVDDGGDGRSGRAGVDRGGRAGRGPRLDRELRARNLPNPWRRPFIDLLVYGVIGLAVAGATVAAIGPLQVYEQLVDYPAWGAGAWPMDPGG